MKLRWNRSAEREYVKSLAYVAEDSLKASKTINERVKQKLARLCAYPLMYPPDAFKSKNPEKRIRAFTSDSMRISYHVFKSSIHIIRVRHVKRKPLPY